MKLCDQTITVFNRRQEEETGYDLYIPTVINGVSWFCRIEAAVNNGLQAANMFVIRIPIDADTMGREYTDPVSYKNAGSVDNMFTLANGDIIVKAAVAVAPMTPAELHAAYNDCCTIVGVTDNRHAPNGKHFKVVGK